MKNKLYQYLLIHQYLFGIFMDDIYIFLYILNKLLFKKIGVDGIESITKRDRKKTTIIKHKYDLICSHTGRRTYISVNLQKGIRPDTLMKTTGHRSYETMLIYVQQQQDSIFNEMYNKIEN